MKKEQQQLLLSSVVRPFGQAHGDGFGASFDGSHQIMWAEGVFRTQGTSEQWGLDFIAANLQVPTTVLHYPTLQRFLRELRKGYQYVGISFVPATEHKMKTMVREIRARAPATKIILGGYGTAMGSAIEGYGDHICRGEGVAFMRRLLGEREDRPIEQPFVTQSQKLFSLPVLGKTGYVFASVGCPNGCDFCATSHFYDRKHLHFLPDGRSILEAIRNLRRRDPSITSIYISDEDFLLRRSRGRQFLEAIRESDLPPLNLSIFSSVKALSRFRARELVEMGIDFVWVGFEGKRAGYAKMKGRSYADLFSDLHHHGISVLASMIIGFDYQTPEVIREEYEELLALRPSLCQFLIYGPAFGTPLKTKLEAEGRLIAERIGDPRHRDGFSLVFRHPHIGAEEMAHIQNGLYREEFRRLGPSVFRMVDDWLTGYENLRHDTTPRVRQKAELYGKLSHRALQLIPASRAYASPEAAAWLGKLEQRLADKTGPMTMRERVTASTLVPAALRLTDFRMQLGLGEQPRPTCRRYRQGRVQPAAATAHLARSLAPATST